MGKCKPSCMPTYIAAHAGGAAEVFVEGGIVYVIGTDGTLRAFDVDDPADAQLVGSVSVGGMGEQPRIHVDAGLAWIASGLKGVKVVDVSDLDNFTVVGAWDSPGSGFAKKASAWSKYVVVADGLSGLQVLDASDPAVPTGIGTYLTDYATDVAVLGPEVFLADDAGLYVVSLADPPTPALVSVLPTDGPGRLVLLEESEGYVYLVWGYSSNLVSIIDVADLENPAEVNTYSSNAGVSDIDATATYLFLAKGVNGVEVVNVMDKLSPYSTGTIGQGGGAVGVQAYGGYLYVADSVAGLRIWDVSACPQ